MNDTIQHGESQEKQERNRMEDDFEMNVSDFKWKLVEEISNSGSFFTGIICKEQTIFSQQEKNGECNCFL